MISVSADWSAIRCPFRATDRILFVSLFGMQTQVSSTDKRLDPYNCRPKYDNITKRKYGVEATYSLLSWLAASARFDRVDPNVHDTRYSSPCFHRGSFSTPAGSPLTSSCCSTRTGSTAASPQCGWASHRWRTPQ